MATKAQLTTYIEELEAQLKAKTESLAMSRKTVEELGTKLSFTATALEAAQRTAATAPAAPVVNNTAGLQAVEALLEKHKGLTQGCYIPKNFVAFPVARQRYVYKAMVRKIQGNLNASVAQAEAE